MENNIELNGQMNRLHRLETIKTIALIALALAVTVMAVTFFVLINLSNTLEDRLACRGHANEVIQSAIGRGFVAAIHQDQKAVEIQGENIQRGVEMLEACE